MAVVNYTCFIFNTLSRILNRRKKRLFDIYFSFVFIYYTVWLLLVKKPAEWFRNIVYVLSGISSWWGITIDRRRSPGLARIKPAYLRLWSAERNWYHRAGDEQVNLSYAKDYDMHDLQIILRGFTNLGPLILHPTLIQELIKDYMADMKWYCGMGEGIIEASITRWLVSDGQHVNIDQPLLRWRRQGGFWDTLTGWRYVHKTRISRRRHTQGGWGDSLIETSQPVPTDTQHSLHWNPA